MKRKLPKSLRKYIRREKARIRREVLNLREQEKLIQELYQKIASEQRKVPHFVRDIIRTRPSE